MSETFNTVILNCLRTVKLQKATDPVPQTQEYLKSLIEFQMHVEHWAYHCTERQRQLQGLDSKECQALRAELKHALYLSWPGCEQPTVEQRVDIALLLIDQYKDTDHGKSC